MKPKSPGSEKATAATIIRSHSIPGELHGMHAPDPVAADILRKIPEQETFVRLNVSPLGTVTPLFNPLMKSVMFVGVEN